MSLNLVIMGAPGSGKGTQAKLLSEHFKIEKVSTGDIIRKAIAEKTELGKLADTLIHAGNLVPDDLMIELVEDEFKNSKSMQKGFILDGFPRTPLQGDALGDILKKQGRKLDAVILLNVSMPELVRRLSGRLVCLSCGATFHESDHPPKVKGKCDKCGSKLEVRKDDNPESISWRMKVYNAQTRPVIEYYKNHGILFEVNGEGEVKQIFQEITARIAQLQK